MTRTLVAAAFVLLWSCGFVGAAWGTAAADPAGLLAWRYVITAALLLAVVPLVGFSLSRREFGQQCVLGMTAHVAFLGGLFTAAAAGVDAGTTALICSAQPLLVAAAGSALWKDRMTGRQWLGIGLGLVAVAICVGGVGGLGAAVALPTISLLGLSCSALLERHWQPKVHVVTSLTVQVSVAALAFVVVALLTTGMAVDPTPRLAASLAWLVLPAGLGGYGAYLLALRHLGATHTSMLLYLTPPVSGVWAWAMLGDALGGTQIVAMALGLVAVFLAAGGRLPLRRLSTRIPPTRIAPARVDDILLENSPESRPDVDQLDARYAMLADSVESGEYEVVEGSITVRDDYSLGHRAHGS